LSADTQRPPAANSISARTRVDYMTALPEHREIHATWQNAYKLILARAADVTRARSLALFMDLKLDLHVPQVRGTRR
jgi:hypothetical protein